MIRTSWVVLAALVAAGCEPGAEPTTADRLLEPLDWQEAPEDSVVAYAKVGIGEDAQSAFRCWRRNGLYDCLGVQNEPMLGYAIQRVVTDQRPENPINFDLDRPGYKCEWIAINAQAEESIWGRNDKLTSHPIASAFAPPNPEWSRQFVENYFVENAIENLAPWFDCRYVIETLLDGSLETVRTTSMNYEGFSS